MTHDETTTVRLPKPVSKELDWLSLQVGCRKGEVIALLLQLAMTPGMITRLREMRLAKIGGDQ
jgi:hypothetical protein